jgi:HEPN domain-containing protein
MSKQREETARRLRALAEDDLYSAEALSRLDRVPVEVVAFLCQQAVEKALKACLTLAAAEPPPRTHSLRLLSERMSELGLPALDDDDARLLSAYAVAPRYGAATVSLEAAMEAVAAARRFVGAYEAVLRRLLGEDA